MQPCVTGRPPIPAMTTDAERECYYRLVRDGAAKGEVVELGAWLGASTAYIAAAIRDAGVSRKAHVYDKFQVKPSHEKKLEAFYGGKAPGGPSLGQYQANLGPLLEFVETHPGQIEAMRWRHGKIAVLISDAPKRVPAISAVLTEFKDALSGAVMAWQDFCHFPSYDIPACLYRIREHIEFTEAVVPGTTMVFRVTSPWGAGEVSREALTPKRWTADEIAKAWAYWLKVVPSEKASLFECGRALFLVDIGKVDPAKALLNRLLDEDADGIVPKWQYLHDGRSDLVKRYRPLFDVLASRGLLNSTGGMKP